MPRARRHRRCGHHRPPPALWHEASTTRAGTLRSSRIRWISSLAASRCVFPVTSSNQSQASPSTRAPWQDDVQDIAPVAQLMHQPVKCGASAGGELHALDTLEPRFSAGQLCRHREVNATAGLIGFHVGWIGDDDQSAAGGLRPPTLGPPVGAAGNNARTGMRSPVRSGAPSAGLRALSHQRAAPARWGRRKAATAVPNCRRRRQRGPRQRRCAALLSANKHSASRRPRASTSNFCRRMASRSIWPTGNRELTRVSASLSGRLTRSSTVYVTTARPPSGKSLISIGYLSG